jgi:hypothetical protein
MAPACDFQQKGAALRTIRQPGSDDNMMEEEEYGESNVQETGSGADIWSLLVA